MSEIGWVIDTKALFAIKSAIARVIMGEILEALDPESRNQVVCIQLNPLIKQMGWHPQSAWRAMNYLEKAGFLCRPRGSCSWSSVYVNPFIKRPFHMNQAKAQEIAQMFNPINTDWNKLQRCVAPVQSKGPPHEG